MDNMVERLARVIDPEAWDDEFTPAFPSRSRRQGRALDTARAALNAMREPSESMVAAAGRQAEGPKSSRSARLWQAMIDAALASGQGEAKP